MWTTEEKAELLRCLDVIQAIQKYDTLAQYDNMYEAVKSVADISSWLSDIHTEMQRIASALEHIAWKGD